MLKRFGIKIVFISFLSIIFLPFFAFADSQGQVKTFFVDSSYDAKQREQISATLEKVSQNAYFYLEDEWYKNLTEEEKEKVDKNLITLSQEFDQKIYPQLTSTYGQEWKPGIDNDQRITILFHQMREDAAGYFKTEDEYPKVQSPRSNEREMVYLATDSLKDSLAPVYLAHEFTHLITFNQKERLRGVSEETWLNEARADYSPTLLGYDSEYQGSNLQQRVKQFLSSPSDSLTEWQNQRKDYGVVNLFIHYLVDHYGIKILVDSLKSSKVGIESINEALKENGYQEDFSQIFTNWTIAVFLNDCNFGEKYCYKTEALKNLKITPALIFLPSTQKTQVSLNYSIKQWSGNWYRIMGGEGELKLEFDGEDKVQFKLPYVLCRDTQKCQVDFLNLDKNQKGEISFENFGKDWSSLTLIPSIQSKISGFNGREPFYNFRISASIEMKSSQEKLIEELKTQIAALKAQIAQLQAKIAEILRKKVSCQRFENNLYYGMKNEEVRCLQEFLKAQGPEIYPEGLVTGFFGPLTQRAVIRFQEKYAEDILYPLGLKKGTGFVGPSTRSKINQLLNITF
ncbi:MAG: hypothetical protein DRH33_00495 [Candidatus Nealsonbacteria bacterium]|nr:MAG: hypothetical protein DRH33_00495 [Candidatus Nealsonbacteria bacterium]